MALTGNLTADQAAVKYDFPECYARIMVVTATKDEARIIMNFYADSSARAQEAAPVLQKEYQTTPLDGAAWPAGYTYLKTLPEFANWSDV
jgi:hypothetical protein